MDNQTVNVPFDMFLIMYPNGTFVRIDDSCGYPYSVVSVTNAHVWYAADHALDFVSRTNLTDVSVVKLTSYSFTVVKSVL